MRSGPARRAPSRALDGQVGLLSTTRAVRVGHDRAADAVQRRGERVCRESRGEPVEPFLAAGERGCRTRQCPTRRLGGCSHVGLLGGRVADEHGHELAAPPAALALDP